MEEAWWGSVTQTCQHSVQGHRKPQQNTWSISSGPALSHSQDLHLRFLYQLAGTIKSGLSTMTCGKAGRRAEWEQRHSSHFLGRVTKAHDRGEEDPRDLAGAACSPGDLVCTSQPPLHHHKPKNGQLAQTAKSQMSFCWYLSKSWDSVGCMEARAT